MNSENTLNRIKSLVIDLELKRFIPKCNNVINSCKTIEQRRVAINYINLLENHLLNKFSNLQKVDRDLIIDNFQNLRDKLNNIGRFDENSERKFG